MTLISVGGIRQGAIAGYRSCLHTFEGNDGILYLWSRKANMPALEIGKTYYIEEGRILLDASSTAKVEAGKAFWVKGIRMKEVTE